MKNWKQSVFFGVVAIIVLIFTACGSEDNDPCKCDPKAHLGIGENCNCGGSGCNCTVQIAWLGGVENGVKIQKETGISVEEMNDTVGKINEAYGKWLPTYQTALAEIIDEIHIVSGNEIARAGKILNVGANATEADISSQMMLVALGLL
jgi:hypothetical protein